MNTAPLLQVARFAASTDNVAIATRRLERNQRLQYGAETWALSHPLLEGHRLATRPIPQNGLLLSWGLPFGQALRPIKPGDYVCNEKILQELRVRQLDFDLPDKPNFLDFREPCLLDSARFIPGSQVPLHPSPGTFLGYERGSQRGAGTRNFIAILGASSRTASYARALAEKFRGSPSDSFDGVVAIAHTEGGGASRPNNFELVLRTLAGFMVHPNIGAVLSVDEGSEPVNNKRLAQFMEEHQYPLQAVRRQFMTLREGFESSLRQGEAIVRAWLNPVQSCQRAPQPLARLGIALQCGGSDAFSGVSGNPLAGWIAKELIRHGGCANLAETSELIGAEPYILENTRDLATAQTFLDKLDRFQEWASWHGHSAEGNPSGGNLYRGLYNIVIKSIGAARKKDPKVRLDYCLDYGQPMTGPGFYFMDSPGNDLESIAGQVASGCNLILFITGNGSITNFPFVPTLKIVSTTGRYNLLSREMDINAGRYLDGEALDELGQEGFALARRVASGQRSVGEAAGHSQVQLWREWRQTKAGQLPEINHAPLPSGLPIPLASSQEKAKAEAPVIFEAFSTPHGPATDQIALILPTSLCSGQIALRIADALNLRLPAGVTRCVALPHTEGCGVSRGDSERLYLRTMAGYLCHPMVGRALLLEHGCEKTHNDEMRRFLKAANIDPSGFGWASIQLDGGIEAVTGRVVDWFQATARSLPATCPATWRDLRVGLLAETEPPDEFCAQLAILTRKIIGAGGAIVVPDRSPILRSPLFRELLQGPVSATIDYGQMIPQPGFHVMNTPSDHRSEWVAGLGATGVSLFVVYTNDAPWQAHPMIPMLQAGPPQLSPDIDLVWPAPALGVSLDDLIIRTAAREYAPFLMARGNTDFQITRGLVGVSL